MITREEVLAELAELGIVLKGGSVYQPKTMHTITFDFYDDGGRKGLKLTWFDQETVTAKIIAEAIRDLRGNAHPINDRALWFPLSANMLLRWPWPDAGPPKWVPWVQDGSSG